MYLSVLSRKQIGLLKKLRFLKKYGFYLAGGTALALQIGHRTSLDFDFYTQKSFDSKRKLYLFSFVSWSKVKKFLIEKVRDYQKKWLKQTP